MKAFRIVIAVVLAVMVGCGIGWAIAAWSKPAPSEQSADVAALRRQVADLDSRLNEQNETISALRAENNQLESKMAAVQSAVSANAADTTVADALRVQQAQLLAVLKQVRHLETKSFGDTLRGGTILRESGYLDEAMVELCKAIAMAPEHYGGYANRGMVYQDLGEWEMALADFEKAAQLNPDNIVGWNNLAWLKATCPDERFRDGGQAVEHATKACEMTNWKNFATLSTLAAAYAETGDFSAAVQWQQKSLELAPEIIHAKLEESLTIFKAEKPLRETVSRHTVDSAELTP